MTTLTELLERVRAATGPDREIDRDLFYTVDPESRRRFEGVLEFVPELPWERWVAFKVSHPYTASIDAALAFAERMRPGVGEVRKILAEAAASLYGETDFVKKLPLAILAALLSALIAQEQT